MHRFLLTSSLTLSTLASFSVFACSDKFNGEPSSSDGGQGGAGTDVATTGGTDGLGGSGSQGCTPSSVDLPDDDFEDSNCDGIDGDAKSGIFVSPDGDDLASGTLKDPVATINAAISLAQAKEADVYICNGEYDREIRIEDVGVNLYGGYDCEDGWKRVADRAVINPQVGVPLTIRGVEGVIIERLVFKALDNLDEGGSSVAAVIMDSEDVQLRRVELESGQAGPGKPGASSTQVATAASKGADGGTCRGSGCFQPGLGGNKAGTRSCAGGDSALPGGRGGTVAPLCPLEEAAPLAQTVAVRAASVAQAGTVGMAKSVWAVQSEHSVNLSSVHSRARSTYRTIQVSSGNTAVQASLQVAEPVQTALGFKAVFALRLVPAAVRAVLLDVEALLVKVVLAEELRWDLF